MQESGTEASRRLAGPTGPENGGIGAVRPDLEQIFRREYPRVHGIARRVLGDARAAEDVAQDVFVAFGRSSVPVGEAAGWLAVAASHTALNLLRTERRRRDRERRAAAGEHLPDIADHVVRATERARVRQVLGRLPRRQALVVLLRHSGLSYQEIAAATGMAAGGIGTTLRRAEAAARKELERS